MNIKIRILSLLSLLIFTANYVIKAHEIEDLNNFIYNEIKENEINRINKMLWLTPVNDSTIVLTDAVSRVAHFINFDGEILNSIYPSLKFADSIATNKTASSKYRGEYYRFLFLNEITYPPNSPKAGELFPDSLIDIFIKRGFIKCNVINDSVVGIAATYEMFVQDMDPETKSFSRGKEDTPILVFYNYLSNSFEKIEYLQNKNNLFPRNYSIKFNNKDNRIYAVVINYNKKTVSDSIPFVVSFNGNKEMEIQKYLPEKISKYAQNIDLFAPIISFSEEKMYCIFRLLDEVYNLSDNTTFKIQNLYKDNIDFIESYNISNPEFEKINFSVNYIGKLMNQNLLLITDNKKENDNQEFLLQEYSLDGKLLKSKSIPKYNPKIGMIMSLKGLENNNWIFGLSYNEENEKYYLIRIEF